jgi:hypothetical protein
MSMVPLQVRPITTGHKRYTGAVLVPLVAIIVVAAALAYYAFGGLPASDELLRPELAAPRTAIGHLVGGVVTVNGRARREGAPVIAPLSGRPCLAFQITLHADRSDDFGLVAHLAAGSPFWIEDETGRALVDVTERFEIVKPGSGPLRKVSPALLATVRRFAEERRISTRSWRFARDLHCREGIIVEGEELVVGGHAAQEARAEGEPSGPRQPATCMVLRAASRRAPLVVATRV